MSKQFKGTIKLDVRDSKADWTPYEQPKAPAGAPNVLIVLYDDTGLAAWTALAAATSARHPGLALAVAHANFPEQTGLVAGAIVIYIDLHALLLFPLRALAGNARERAAKSPHGTYRPTR